MDRHPPNAPGPFYVENDQCILCGTPYHAAPNLISNLDEIEAAQSCYFKRQPNSPAEEDEAVKAMHASCCKAVRYAGTDQRILGQLRALNLLEYADSENP